mmetsp:Transcript_57489/g.95079  ORF Transcript_57489/g.95079 Transcript_57489/m.95079 type:complete len:215 (+) Transcript_57489:674-1318(+)
MVPSTITPTRAHRASHSSIECVVSTVQHEAVRRFMTDHKKRFEAASMPDDGSSKSTTAGRPTKAIPTHNLRLFPPEYVPDGLSANLVRSRSEINWSTSISSSLLGTFLIRPYSRMSSRPVIRLSSASCCGQKPMRFLMASWSLRMERPLILASPDEGGVAPVSIENVVLFPAPFTPRKPKHSPCSILRQRSRTATLPPWPPYSLRRWVRHSSEP